MDFWAWLMQPGGILPDNNPGYYSSGQAQPAEYVNAITRAIENLQYASDPSARQQFFARLQQAGGLLPTDDIAYWADPARTPADFADVIAAAPTRLYTAASQAPPAPALAAPSPSQPAPGPAPAPVTPPTPTPPAATAPPPPEPRDFRAEAAVLYPWLNPTLLNMFSDLWADSGDATLALAYLRQTDEYDSFFPGIKRDDGSLRMSESEWFSTREAYSRLLSEFGLNPTLFEGRFTELMKGETSPAELAGRLGAAYELMTNIPEARQAFAELYGIDASDAALFAFFIDPEIGDALLARKITVAQISGEGLARGFDVDAGFAERLASGGVDQQAARAFYIAAEGQLQTLDTLVKRHNDPDDTFDLIEFADANVFGDAETNRRIQRVLRAEASLFTDRLGSVATSDDFRLTGLSAR